MAWRKLLLEATKYMYIMDDYGYLKAEVLIRVTGICFSLKA